MHGYTIAGLGRVALLLIASGAAQAQAAALRVELDAAGAFTRSHDWSIDKRVTPASADRFIGETQSLDYTLTLVRGAPRDSGFLVTGRAVIRNETASDATISSIAITYGGMPITHACASGPLAAGTSRSCDLQFAAPDAGTRVLAIDVAAGAASAQADTTVAFAAPVVSHASVHVSDPRLDAPVVFHDSGTHRYTHVAKCVDGNTVVAENTATLVETGATASATARIACHATRMERAVETFGGTRWRWDLSKTHAATLPLQATAGNTYRVEYTITAIATAADGARTVHGAITAINTHPSADAVILSVQARINATDAVVTCPAPMIAPSSSYNADRDIVIGRLTCPFTVTLAAGETPATVTGRVEQQLFDHDSAGNATAAGTRVLQGTQPVPALPAGPGTDACMRLADVYLGTTHDLGEHCADDDTATVTRSFAGDIAVTAQSECAFSVPNLARLITADTGTRAEATTSVSVERTDCVASAPAGTLQLDITGSGSFARNHAWTIAKQVTPASADRFVGETQRLAYTLTLVKGDAQDAGFRIRGQATIANPTAVAADIRAVAVAYDGIAVPNACATGALAAGESRTCALDFAVSDAAPRTLSIHVTAGDDVAGGDASSLVEFAAPTVSGDRIRVDDTLLPAGVEFTRSGTHQYTHDATCAAAGELVVDNTATLVDTGASDSARARIMCHVAGLELSAAASAGPSWRWDLEKTHGLSAPLSLAAGESHDVAYVITATATAADTATGTVQGTITALNPNPGSDMVIVSMQARINDTPATVTCPPLMRAPASSGAAGRLTCRFTATLAAGETAATVTGRVEQQAFDYDPSGVATPARTTVQQHTTDVDATPAATPADRCVRLADIYLGTRHDLGEFCAGPGALSVSRAFTGRITVPDDAECRYGVANAAVLVALDSGASREAFTRVDVERADCAAGEPVVGVVVANPGPVTIPSTSPVTLLLLALLLGTGAAVLLPARLR